MVDNITEADMSVRSDNESGGVGITGPFAKIVFSLSSVAVFTKIFGFTEKLVIANFFGTADVADVYFAATGVLLSVVWLVRELVYPTLLPVFAGGLSKGLSVSARLFRKVFLTTTGLLVGIAVVLAVFGGTIVSLLLPGFSDAKRQMTAGLLRTLAPAVLFFGLTMVTYTVLNARRSFLKAAVPQACLKLIIVVGLLAMLPVLGIYSLAVVLGLGALGSLLVQLYFIPERRFLFRRNSGPRENDGFRKVLVLMGPLVVGVVFSHISALVDNLLASTLPAGQLSYLGYSKKLIDAILLIGPVALVTVVYSHLSHLASAKEYERFTELVAKAFRILRYLTVPAAWVLVALKQPMVRCLFERGRFGADSTAGTSRAFMIYAFGLTTFSLEALLVHSFFALSDTKTPVKFGVLCVFLDIALAILFLKPFGCLGIAGALVISKTVKVLILAGLLNARLKGLFSLKTAGFAGKLAVSGVVVWVVVKLLLGINNPDSLLHTALLDLLLPATGGLAAFVFCSYLLRVDEFKAALSLLRHRKSAVRGLYGETK